MEPHINKVQLKKYRVGIVVASMSRNAGGIFWVLTSLVRVFKRANIFDVLVLAGQDKFSKDDLIKWHGCNVKIFPQFGPKSFGYQLGLLRRMLTSSIDLVHVHGIWMYPSLATFLWSYLKKPYIVSPHGMLDSWAVSRSHVRKKIASIIYEKRHLKGANCIHALCESEYLAIRAFGLINPVAIIPNGVALPILSPIKTFNPSWKSSVPSDSKTLLFMGRLHPKKGLTNLLFAWSSARKKNPIIFENWHLIIAGWGDKMYEQEISNLIDTLELNLNTHLVGPIFDGEKDSTLRAVSAFILPSFSEGLPMAVLEAWAYQLPVLITPQCNLEEGFSTNSAIRIEPDISSIEAGILNLTSMSDISRSEMGVCGRHLVENIFAWEVVANKFENVYEWILGNEPKPDFIKLN